MGKNRIGVLVVDRNPLLCEGLSVLIRLQPDMELVAVTRSPEEVVQLFDRHRPDVILMDSDLPFGAGINAIRSIRSLDPKARILALVAYEWDDSWSEALRSGAWRCIAKDRLNDELVALIRECAKDAG